MNLLSLWAECIYSQRAYAWSYVDSKKQSFYFWALKSEMSFFFLLTTRKQKRVDFFGPFWFLRGRKRITNRIYCKTLNDIMYWSAVGAQKYNIYAGTVVKMAVFSNSISHLLLCRAVDAKWEQFSSPTLLRKHTTASYSIVTTNHNTLSRAQREVLRGSARTKRQWLSHSYDNKNKWLDALQSMNLK